MLRRLLLITAAFGASAALAACGSSSNPDAGDTGATIMDALPGQDVVTFHDAMTTPDMGVVDTGVDAGPTDVSTARSIAFLHTNDEHSHELGFAPEKDDTLTEISTSSTIMGGVKRRLAVISKLRTEAQNAGAAVAVVSAGDEMIGSLFHLADPSLGIDYTLAQIIGYDVLTLGNHEFDFGPGALANAITQSEININPQLAALGVKAIPIVTSNIRFSATDMSDDALAALWTASSTPDPQHPLQHTLIKTFGNVKVGFVGVMGIDAAFVSLFKRPVRFSVATTTVTCMMDASCGPGSTCVPPAATPTATSGNCSVTANESDPVHFRQLVADVAAAVGELRQQGVDLVVAVSHSGVNETELAALAAAGMGPEHAKYSEEILLAEGVDAALNGTVKGLDAIIGGHSHTALHTPLAIPNPKGGITTYIVQAGSYGRWVGELRLNQAAAGQPWTIDMTNSKLTRVDGTVDIGAAPSILATILDQVTSTVASALETRPYATAGNGQIELGEECDGTTLPMGGCAANPLYTGGTLSCFMNRQLDWSACTPNPAGCPAGTCNAGTGATVACSTVNPTFYDSGNATCNQNCSFDTHACVVHFPTILEVIVNFPPIQGYPIRHMAGALGDLFFYTLGRTTYDLPSPTLSHESNIMNLVTDAERWSANTIAFNGGGEDPITVFVTTNGLVRDGIAKGSTGALDVEDLIRVLPLGVSPIENSPGYPIIDFHLLPAQLLAALEISVNQGLGADSFWFGVSGLKVEYDLSRPVFTPTVATSGRITKISFAGATGNPFDETVGGVIFDRAAGGFTNANSLIHVGTSMYIGLFMEGLGICPIDIRGTPAPFASCAPCMTDAGCVVPGTICDVGAGHCAGGPPVAFQTRTLVGNPQQELKEFLALTGFVKLALPAVGGMLPMTYAQPVPRRMCCTGAACPADRVCQ
jgi:2',3'-cyclic-nucleotide 2'-phosphodiesterase (5'-nucleotidase family)